MHWLVLNILNHCNFISMSVPCLAGIQCSMSSLWTQLGSTKYWSTSNYSWAIKVTMSEPFFSNIMLYKIQQHTTTSSKKTTCKLVLSNNSLKKFFKIPNEFSTKLVLQLNCLQHLSLNWIVYWIMIPKLYNEHCLVYEVSSTMAIMDNRYWLWCKVWCHFHLDQFELDYHL